MGAAGLLLLLLAAQAGPRPAHAAPAKPGAARPVAARQAPGPVHLPTVASAPDLLPLAAELSREIAAELQRQHIEVLPSKGDTESTVDGRLEAVAPEPEAPGTGVRLRLIFRGSTIDVSGDLERLDDLARESAALLKPALEQRASHDDGGYAPPAPPTPPPPRDKVRHDAPPRPATPPPTPITGRPPVPPPVEPPREPPPPREPAPPPPDLALPPDPHPPEPAHETPRREEPPRHEEPVHREEPPREPPIRREEPLRVAVNVVGEPYGQSPFAGVGRPAQQTVMAYLQRRLRVHAIPTGLIGLVSGADARDVSLRSQARFTLMARFDSLSVVSSAPGYGPLSLVGRVHVVLLYDGNAVLDRSLAIPARTFIPSEPPASVVSRGITAVLDQIYVDLQARLAAAP